MKQINKKAFTLVEVLVVIVIIGILFIVLVSKVDFSTGSARESGAQTDLRSFELAATSVGLQHGGFTDDMSELAKQLNKKLDSEYQVKVKSGNLVSSYEDPWGNNIKISYYEPVEANGELHFICAGKDKEFYTEDDLMLVVRYDTSTGRGEIMTEHPTNTKDHTHMYNQQVVAPQYLYKEANCTSAAQYFYSCSCGEANRVVFQSGALDTTNHGDPEKQFVWLSTEKHLMEKHCSNCDAILESSEEEHAKTADGKACTLCGSTNVGYIGP